MKAFKMDQAKHYGMSSITAFSAFNELHVGIIVNTNFWRSSGFGGIEELCLIQLGTSSKFELFGLG